MLTLREHLHHFKVVPPVRLHQPSSRTLTCFMKGSGGLTAIPTPGTVPRTQNGMPLVVLTVHGHLLSLVSTALGCRGSELKIKERFRLLPPPPRPQTVRNVSHTGLAHTSILGWAPYLQGTVPAISAILHPLCTENSSSQHPPIDLGST